MRQFMTPEPPLPLDFRAPPPSPVAPGRRSSFANDDVLTEYLHQSLKVPDLVLPDKVFPRHNSLQTPPKLDFQKLHSLEIGKFSHLVAQLGCLEVINHGIPRDLIDFVLELGNAVFQIPPEKKRAVTRSLERRYGFEEIHDEEQKPIKEDESEEFVWSAEEAMQVEMEGIWPFRYSNFSREMENLSVRIGDIGKKVLKFLDQHSLIKIHHDNDLQGSSNMCCVQKRWRRKEAQSEMNNSVRYDVLRMLIRGNEFPHALCLHICSGAADFHVYSRKGWISFCPDRDSIVVTVGDKLQEWSGGQYKHVIGKPVLKDEDGKRNNISMSFLYSPPSMTMRNDEGITISVIHQIFVAILLILVYQFSVSVLSFVV